MTRFKYVIASLLLALSCVTFAASSPVAMLQTVADQMISALKETSNRNEANLNRIVNELLIPHVDRDLMSQEILGKYWTSANHDQKEAFKTEFTRYVVRTYSTALASYTNQKVRFFPIRGGVSGSRVRVNSAIDQSNGQSVSVVYRLDNSSGDWRVYDFSVEGISLVDNYRQQFADVLRSGGMQGLLDQLKKRGG